MRYTIYHSTPGGAVIPKQTFSSRTIANRVLADMRQKYPWREYQIFESDNSQK